MFEVYDKDIYNAGFHAAFSLLQRIVYKPVREKTNNLGFQPGPTQTSLYSHRR